MSNCSFPVFQEREGEWTSSKTFFMEGIRIPDLFTPDPAALRDYIVNFQTRSDDVFVVTYPKSGTTWLQEILWQVYNNGERSTKKIFERVPMLERGTSSGRIDVTTLPSPRLLHTHLTYDVIPKGKTDDAKCKYIYVMRNPKDVAVSFYEFVKPQDSTSVLGFNGPWEFFARLFLAGKEAFGLWTDHVLGWWKHKDDSNVLMLKYEDLKKDLPSGVRRIAEFLDKPLTADVLNRIAENCSFEVMNKNPSSYWLPDGLKLLRKGEIGDWKNYFTPELNERFEEEVLDKLRGTGIELDFGS